MNAGHPGAGGEGDGAEECATFCLGLMDHLAQRLDGKDAETWSRLRQQWLEGERSACAEECLREADDTLSRHEKQAAERASQQAAEMQNLLIALNQALLSMAEGSETGVKSLRKIEFRLRAASQSSDIDSLKSALRDTIDFVSQEANRQRQETASLLERMDHDLAEVRASVGNAGMGLAGREEAIEAVRKLGKSAQASKLLAVVVRFDHLKLLAGRFSAAVAEEVVWRIAQTYRSLAYDHVVFRWHFDALVWFLELRSPLDTTRAQLEARFATPCEHRTIARGRTVMLSVSLKWMSAILGETAPDSLMEQIDRFAGVERGT